MNIQTISFCRSRPTGVAVKLTICKMLGRWANVKPPIGSTWNPGLFKDMVALDLAIEI